ncbi:MAG: hypothetical protein ACM3SY_13920 [Candidatus Omnitrophota bacterium]
MEKKKNDDQYVESERDDSDDECFQSLTRGYQPTEKKIDRNDPPGGRKSDIQSQNKSNSYSKK